VRGPPGGRSTTHRKFSSREKGFSGLAPAWVPRVFCIPGRRIKLHPDDYYAFGAQRGGIDERWFSSTTRADNGPLTTPDEGLSYVVYEEHGSDQKVLLKDLIDDLGAGCWAARCGRPTAGGRSIPSSSTTKVPLPHHLHQMQEHAALVGQDHKPEAYFSTPAQQLRGNFPHTFFGLEPGTGKEQVRHCLEIWDQGDNRITDLSKAYRLEVGTGWYVPPGVLHAPGSLCTYEPQWASDVFSMFESFTNDDAHQPGPAGQRCARG
jgi:hypothetical protein